jgi:hypothetical protein
MPHNADRYALLLLEWPWRMPPLDNHLVGTLQQWWLHRQPSLLQRWSQAVCWYCGTSACQRPPPKGGGL